MNSLNAYADRLNKSECYGPQHKPLVGDNTIPIEFPVASVTKRGRVYPDKAALISRVETAARTAPKPDSETDAPMMTFRHTSGYWRVRGDSARLAKFAKQLKTWGGFGPLKRPSYPKPGGPMGKPNMFALLRTLVDDHEYYNALTLAESIGEPLRFSTHHGPDGKPDGGIPYGFTETLTIAGEPFFVGLRLDAKGLDWYAIHAGTGMRVGGAQKSAVDAEADARDRIAKLASGSLQKAIAATVCKPESERMTAWLAHAVDTPEVVAFVSPEIADAFGMHGLPNTVVTG